MEERKKERNQPGDTPRPNFYGVAAEVFDYVRAKDPGSKRENPSIHSVLKVTNEFVSAVLQVESLSSNLSNDQLAKIAGTNAQVIEAIKVKLSKRQI